MHGENGENHGIMFGNHEKMWKTWVKTAEILENQKNNAKKL